MQHERLDALLAELRADGIDPPLVHMANTAAVLGGVGAGFALVRPGISLYGVLGPEQLSVSGPVEPVMSLRTQIVYLKDVPAGTPIGYYGTHVTARATRVATLPIGYNDGLSYRLSNRGRAIVRGVPAPIIGSISMDYTMLDIGHVRDARTGDAVTLIGREGEHEIGMAELASLIGTIPYEVCCSIGKRVRRVYVRPERVEEAAGAATAQASVEPRVVPVEQAGASIAAEAAVPPHRRRRAPRRTGRAGHASGDAGAHAA